MLKNVVSTTSSVMLRLKAAQAVLADLEALTSTAQILEIFSETFSAICLAAAEEEAVVRTMAR